MHCLFLHIPKFSNVYLPLGEFMNVTYMPMGLPALANRKKGDPHPYVVGTDSVKRYLTVAEECAKAELSERK